MILTFTGTQEGMTSAQRHKVEAFLRSERRVLRAIHHGGCIGADAQFHETAVALGLLSLIEVWPCTIIKKQAALLRGGEIRVVHPVMEPLDRNQEMVYASTHLLATPADYEEVIRSGTWATIRYARRAKLNITIVLPNGSYL